MEIDKSVGDTPALRVLICLDRYFLDNWCVARPQSCNTPVTCICLPVSFCCYLLCLCCE